VTLWLSAALVLMLGALGLAMYLGLRDAPLDRLVGLQLAGALLVAVLLLLSHGFNQSSYLTVPLVLVVLSFAGVLVFLRLLGSRR
jgi:multisubunit Na+/H+ antiporter MnhF subunit